MGLRSRQRRWACALQDRSSMSYGVTLQLRAPLQKRGRAPRVYLIYHPYARIWRGEGYNYGLWLRRRRRRFRFQLAEGAPRFPLLSPLRARALMARPGSARCYGVARQREGSRQNSIGGSGVLSLRHFGLVLFIPLRVGAEESAAAKDANYGLWFGPARCCSTGSGRRDLDLMIRGPAFTPFIPL